MYDCDGILLCSKNYKQVDFRKTWKYLHEIMKSKMNKTKKTLYIVTAMLFEEELSTTKLL